MKEVVEDRAGVRPALVQPFGPPVGSAGVSGVYKRMGGSARGNWEVQRGKCQRQVPAAGAARQGLLSGPDMAWYPACQYLETVEMQPHDASVVPVVHAAPVVLIPEISSGSTIVFSW